MLQTLRLSIIYHIILPNSLNDTSKGIFISFSELTFVLNRHKDTSLSTIELITSY